MEEYNIGYRMTENVNNIIEQYKNNSYIKLDRDIREKDLKGAATKLGEPIFVSKKSYDKKYFDKFVLVDFDSVRERYLKHFKNTIYSFDKRNMFVSSSDYEYENLYDVNLKEFKDYLNDCYLSYYPVNKENVKKTLKWEIDNIIYHKLRFNSFDKDNKCAIIEIRIYEEIIWYADTFTEIFVDLIKEELGNNNLIDDKCGLCHNDIKGIKVDIDNSKVVFYTWEKIHDYENNEDDYLHVRWELVYYGLNNNHDYTLDDLIG